MTMPRRQRRAARVVLADGDGRLLLFRFNPPGGTPFWTLPGGECDPDEDFADAARRELLEETGIAGDPQPIGLVMEYDFTTIEGEPVRALEHYFHHRTTITLIDTSGHTELERATMQEHRWFVTDDLIDWPEPVYPANLADLAAELFGEDA